MRPTTSRHAIAVVTVLAIAAGVTAAALTTGAGAAPIDDKKKQAAAIEGEIEAKGVELAALNEQLMTAQATVDAATATIADAQAGIAAARAETERLTNLVGQRAASVYRSASAGRDTNMFEADAETLATRKQYSDAADARDNDLMDQLDAARQDLGVRRHEAETARASAESERGRLDTLRAQFEAAQAEREHILGQVKGEIATLVAQEAARRRAAQIPKTFNPTGLPPASGSGGGVVGYAQAQLNKPYCYGGTGPDCFDCSGLTLAAWAQVGIALPHSSESQYSSFPHVPMDQLVPGDIVWRPGHDGIYVGGGTAIHATHEGDVVRYISVSYFQGASRPG
jgi:cell wall-associated NlpC family hydrolase